MRPQIVTRGIVLSRTDYQEADRILTILTPDHGKLRVIAKGVRKPKSKLAGGIELLSISDLTVLPSPRELKTLISSRLYKHYGRIVTDIQRTMLAYELLKTINKHTEDEPEPAYFDLTVATMEGLDDIAVPSSLIELWFNTQLLNINGHAPNLKTDTEGTLLTAGKQYVFDFDTMSFREQKSGPFVANHIKLLRLCHSVNAPSLLTQVQDVEVYIADTLALTGNMLRQNA